MGHFSQNRTLSATTSACLIAFERIFKLLACDHDNEYMMLDAKAVPGLFESVGFPAGSE